ncbi:MAG: hypothetical protein E7623_04340 [Ruminococcaceae bacterium]|nr:hypothetical protein [Oscillospiraceae bacterium]
MNRFDITYFHGPFSQYITRPEVIADIAAAGIDLVPIFFDRDTNREAVKLMAKYGLRCVVGDSRISAVYASDDIAGADAAVKEVVEDYKEFSNVAGWDIVDEPRSDKFPVLGAIVNAFRRYSPEKETVINLFPDYARPEQLGNPDYMTHLEHFVNIVRPHYLSYDYYHFLGRKARKEAALDTLDERERLIRIASEETRDRSGFFKNLNEINAVAKKYGIPAMLIVLLTEHGHYRNLTRSEILWEVNMCLAYGMKRISYFTYWCPSPDEYWQWDNAMCDIDGKKMQHYYDVQSINREIRAAGEYLFDKEFLKAYHLGSPEEDTELFASFGNFKAIEGKNGVVGCFSDGSIYLVNRNYKEAESFRIISDEELTFMKDGIFAPLESCEISLGAGEGIIIKA